MGKPFDPFADDDLEFKPEGDATRVLPGPDATRVLSGPPDAAPAPAPRPQPKQDLRLDFSELEDQGGDVSGAEAIGAESLAGDEFLKGIKRKDYEEALARAQASQSAPPSSRADEGRVVRTVKTPVYLLLGAIAALALVLVVGGLATRAYFQRREAERLDAIQKAKFQP